MEESNTQTVERQTAQRLGSFIKRIENLEEEKKEILNHMKEVFDEAKSEGFDVKVMRKVLSLRKMKEREREEMENLTDLYMNAVEQAQI